MRRLGVQGHSQIPSEFEGQPGLHKKKKQKTEAYEMAEVGQSSCWMSSDDLNLNLRTHSGRKADSWGEGGISRQDFTV